NDAAGQRAAVWDWLEGRPDDPSMQNFRKTLLAAAGYQDPPLALELASRLPETPNGDALIKTVAESLLNGGRALYRFDQVLADAPERLKEPLLEAAFKSLRGEDPQAWIERLALLPEEKRGQAMASLAHAWASAAPEEAAEWAASLPTGQTRSETLSALAAGWAAVDPQGAAGWVAGMQPGLERDRTAGALVASVARQYPGEAW